MTRQVAALLRRGPDTDAMPPPDGAVAVRDVFSRLPPHESLVATLYYFEDLSVKQVADVLQIPEGTVKTRLFRARASLKDALAMAEETRS